MGGDACANSTCGGDWTEAVNSIGDIVFILSPDRKILDCNIQTTKYLGKEKHEILGCSCASLIHKCDGPPEDCPFTRAYHSLKREKMLFCEGDRCFEVSADPVLGPDNRVKSVVHMMRDVTEESSRRNAIECSERRLRDMIDASDTGHALARGQKLLFANRRFIEMLGYGIDDDFESIPLTRHIHVSDIDRVCAALDRLEADLADMSRTIEAKVVCKNGTIKCVRMEWRDYRFDGEKCAIISIRDISLEKELEDMKRKVHRYQAQSMLGRVAGRVAHDFNNIMGITLGMSQMLLFANDLPDEMKYYAQAIRETSARGKEITKNLTFFAGNQEPRFSRYNLSEKIDLALDALKKEIKGKRIVMERSADIQDVVGDPLLIMEILKQLIKNAAHATSRKENPVIAIGAAREHGGISILVGDNGCGIPFEYHEEVFEPTFTLKGSQDHIRAYAEDITGSGYGLSNVKKCVELHQGSVSFSSEPGAGSIFRVWLPDLYAGGDEANASGEAECRQAHNGVTGKNILVVEDEVHFANMLCKTLVNNRNEVDIVIDGKSALEALSKKQYDVVSLDCMLPDASGIEIYSKIREMNSSIPIVFVSGAAHFLEMIMEIRSRDYYVGHLLKPFDNLEYVHAINRMISARG